MTQEQAGGLVPEFTIAERLRLARELAHMKQEELAASIDSTRSTIRNYENRDYMSKRKPMVLKQWALATGIDLTWIETGIGSPTTPNPGKKPAPVDRDAALRRLAARKRPRHAAAAVNDPYPLAA